MARNVIYPDSIDGVKAMLERSVNDSLRAALTRLADSGGHWSRDPFVDDVWGFLLPQDGGPSKVIMVVYLAEDDFECDDAFFTAFQVTP
jgi:hypothetical protein